MSLLFQGQSRENYQEFQLALYCSPFCTALGHQEMFCPFSLMIVWAHGSIWVVSSKWHGMLTQGPTPEPKCKLNIPSFVTLPDLLDCFTCTKNVMSIALLVQMMGVKG